MKIKINLLLLTGLLILLAGCSDLLGAVEQKRTIDIEAEKVILEVPQKKSITAGELKQEKITASGYDISYAIKYEKIAGNSAARAAVVTFFLKKGGIESAKRTVAITGFKAPAASTTEQEAINKEVDKLVLDVPNKTQISVEELRSENIEASSYEKSLYTVNYKTIKTDTAKRKAEITVFLTKNGGSVTSKTRTVTIIGFKEKVLPPEIVDITEQQILALFNLTETKITASAAAKKIAQAQGETREGFLFAEAAAVAYDDETGTFTVKVKGTKDSKSFDKTFNISGFTHPYDKQLWGVDKTERKGELKLDAGIEDNLSIEKFIEKANADNGKNIKDFFINTLAFSLSDGNSMVELGETSDYQLSATFEKSDTDKIKIIPRYTVKMCKKVENASEETITQKEQSIRPTIQTDLIKEYFKADDVFEYVLSKTNDHFVKVDSNRFASHYYAMSKFGKTTFLDFDTSQIQKYVDAYAEKDANEHLKLDLTPGIHNPAGGGISADDFTGKLTVTYCLATAEQLEQQSGITHTKTVTRSGFQKIDSADDAFKNHFTFTVIVTPLTEASKSTWIRRTLKYARLFQVEDNSAQGIVTNPLPHNDKPYYLTVNSEENIGATFGVGNYGLSKDTNGRFIYIETITINKTGGEEKFTVSMQLCGNHSIDITTKPFFGHDTP